MFSSVENLTISIIIVKNIYSSNLRNLRGLFTALTDFLVDDLNIVLVG